MSHKELVLDALSHLPENCTFEDMTEKLRFLSAVQAGLDQLDRGETVSHEEVKKNVASWLT